MLDRKWSVKEMSITVQHILDLPILQKAYVLTGMERLQEQQVEWMTATEGPVKDFVRKDEIILTTGMECDSTEKLMEFVKEVDRAEAAALAIATGKFIKEVPLEVVRFAEENNFILIELPWEIRFTDIQRETTKAINQKQHEHIEEAQQMQDRLYDYVIQGKELADIINYVENEINCSIVFTDHYGRVEASTVKTPEKMITLWEKAEADKQVIKEKIDSFLIEKIPCEIGYLIRKEIATNIEQISEGYYLIHLVDESLLEPNVLQTIDSLASATAVWLSREDAIVQTELRLKSQFIWDLAKSKDVAFEEKAQTRANLFGFQLDDPYVCIVGYSEQLELNNGDEYEETLGNKTIIDEMEEEIKQIALSMDKQVAFTSDEDYLIVFFEAMKLDDVTIQPFIDKMNERLGNLIEGAVFSWGIGQEGNGVKKFHESYEKAFSALEMIMAQKEPGDVLRFEETRLNRLLLHVANDPIVKEITQSAIAPLIEYEREREIDLVETFIVYDAEKRNVSQAARALNLHRQSLLYRLDKINKLTNLSVDNPEDAFLLNISIKVYQANMISDET